MFRSFKIISILIILILVSIPVFGEELATLSGRVMDMDLYPVEKALIKVTGLRGHVYTDKNGYFEVYNIPYGEREIVVAAPDYEVDKTTISIYQSNVEFTTTLKRKEETLKPVSINKSDSEPMFGNIYGASGKIELPDVSIYPKKTFNVNYNLFRSKNTHDKYSDQSLSYLSIGSTITDNLELSLFVRENIKRSIPEPAFFSKIGEDVPVFEDLSGIQVKHMGRFKFGDKIDTHYVIGGMFFAKNYLNISNEVYLAIDLPFLEDQKITLVPVFCTGCKKINYNWGFEQSLYKDKKLNTTFVLEAIQNQDRKYRKFNTGFKFKFNDKSVNLFYMSDTDYNLRNYGLGASFLFK